jgi:hypothetical protein
MQSTEIEIQGVNPLHAEGDYDVDGIMPSEFPSSSQKFDPYSLQEPACEVGSKDNFWFGRELQQSSSDDKDEEKQAEEMLNMQERRSMSNSGGGGSVRRSTITKSFMGHCEPEVLFDTANVTFDASVFFKQFWINCFPFLAIVFTPCITNWTNQGFNPKRIYQKFVEKDPGRWSALISDYGVTICFLLALTLPYAVDANYIVPVGDTYVNLRQLLTFDSVVPLACVFVHRLVVAIKYASLSPSEYARYMSVPVTLHEHYSKQLELLQSWDEIRNDKLVHFELQCAAARIGLELQQLFFTIENPEKDAMALYMFLQWQALLLNRSTIRGLTSSPHPDIAEALKRSSNGDYRVNLDFAAMAILVWIEGIGVPEPFERPKNQSDNKPRQPTAPAVAAHDLPNHLNCVKAGASTEAGAANACRKHFPGLEVYQYFSTVAIVSMALMPILFAAAKHWAVMKASPGTFWSMFLASVIMYLVCYVTFKFQNLLLHDACRRVQEAHLLSELLRDQDNVPDFDFMDLAKDNKGRFLFVANGDLDVDGKSKFNNDLKKYIYEVGPQAFGAGSPPSAEGMTKPSNVSPEVFETYLATRMPRLSENVARQSNLMAWNYMRCMFRRMGARFKYRMDLVVLVVFVAWLLLFVGMLAKVVIEDVMYREWFYQTPLPYQIAIGSALMVVLTAANIFQASKANGEYAKHLHLLSKKIMRVEAQACELSDSEVVLSQASREEYKTLVTLKSSMELTAVSVKLTDEQVPVTILNIPATRALFTTFVSSFVTFFVALFSTYFTASNQGNGATKSTAAPTFAPT